ncbi:PREDICTED: uncharacterized protein At5g08430-like isoform X2 [Nelumbo nucifera]|uniref:Uncharacterized protein At5g08430-like isoform X2 n=1 Tax=Nelumbo nucifera TaxID=4432 RepID=A0A1U8B2P3_NELNU|nr:PREDICTED: uncharacterized protein At5g08430-like isoform X2 [Nelumbo nucifera]
MGDSLLSVIISWHSCFICNKSPKFHCLCCTNAVCQRCIKESEFVQIRGKKGFCNHCLKLTLLIEENVDVDSDGGKVDFKDTGTYEFLFMEYWQIVKEKEGLTLENLHFADSRLKKGEKYRSGSDSDELTKCEEADQLLISDLVERMEEVDNSRGQLFFSMKKMKKFRSKKKEFIGWGSKDLIEFLASIGKDTSKKLSQFEVSDIIRDYIRDKNLGHPEKKKKVLCDSALKSIFRKKSVSRNKIYELLEGHLSENKEESEEDEFRYSLDDEEEDVSRSCQRRRKLISDGKSCRTGKVVENPKSCFASIVSKNIKLVYLKRSLIMELLSTPETFADKVTGSFVRVKTDPHNYLQRNSHQLHQVVGVKKPLGTGDPNEDVLLQVTDVRKEINISLLSDDDFPEEECEDLRQRVKNGFIKKPTVVELDQKARSLHEDITNHSIERELCRLKHLIDRANEKGWRRELFEYLERRKLLQTPSERLRLLQETPTIIAEEIEPEPTPQDTPVDEKQGENGHLNSVRLGIISSLTVGRTDASGGGAVFQKSEERKTEEEQNHFGASVREEKLQVDMHISNDQTTSFIQGEQHQSGAHASEKQQHHPSDAHLACATEHKYQPMEINEQISSQSCIVGLVENAGGQTMFIELSDDEDSHDGGKNPSLAFMNHIPEHPESYIWYYLDPFGEIQGPVSMSLLKRWSESNYFDPDFKVWKTNQSKDDAVLLTDALSRIFPKDYKKKL